MADPIPDQSRIRTEGGSPSPSPLRLLSISQAPLCSTPPPLSVSTTARTGLSGQARSAQTLILEFVSELPEVRRKPRERDERNNGSGMKSSCLMWR